MALAFAGGVRVGIWVGVEGVEDAVYGLGGGFLFLFFSLFFGNGELTELIAVGATFLLLLFFLCLFLLAAAAVEVGENDGVELGVGDGLRRGIFLVGLGGSGGGRGRGSASSSDTVPAFER